MNSTSTGYIYLIKVSLKGTYKILGTFYPPYPRLSRKRRKGLTYLNLLSVLTPSYSAYPPDQF